MVALCTLFLKNQQPEPRKDHAVGKSDMIFQINCKKLMYCACFSNFYVIFFISLSLSLWLMLYLTAMAKFARDCRIAMDEVCCRLEKTLGPDTGELQLRFGLHSGPVTAGG